MAVTLTEKAANAVKQIMEREIQAGRLEAGAFLRVGVTGGGCSGFTYSLGFDKNLDEKLDSRFECHGVPVVVDKKSALYLDGTTVDYYDGIEKQGFTFDNPNAVRTCGCGSSFSA